jgi:hypothetical protein
MHSWFISHVRLRFTALRAYCAGVSQWAGTDLEGKPADMWWHLVCLCMFAFGPVAEGSRSMPLTATVSCAPHTGQQQQDVVGTVVNLLDWPEASGQQHVLMKVRMLPTAATTLLSASRAGEWTSRDPSTLCCAALCSVMKQQRHSS